MEEYAMNEQTRELAEQAKEYAINRLDETGELHKYYDVYFGKFAELIVLECVRYFNEDYQRDFDTRWREDLSKGIKNHFGVES